MKSKLITFFTILSLIFSIDAYSCSNQEMRKKAEKIMKQELGRKNLLSVESDTPANSSQFSGFWISVRAKHKNGNNYIMYIRFEMNRSNLECDVAEKTIITENDEIDEGICDNEGLEYYFNKVMLADEEISEIRDFKMYSRQRFENKNNTYIQVASCIDDYKDLRWLYIVFEDKGDTCKLIDYTYPTYN